MIVIFFLGVVGLIIGSFAGAQVWRLRYRQLVEDKAAGVEYDKAELRRLEKIGGKKGAADRSRCLSCDHQLRWYDLLPLVSWLSTHGHCRYCHKPIGWFEPSIELGVSAFFVLSYLLWPYGLASVYEITLFSIWMITGVLLAILFAYDAKWFLLPDRIVYPAIGTSLVFAGLLLHQDFSIEALIGLVGAIGIMSGLYFAVWLVSKGAWIGFGDVKLGVILGLLLGSWEYALLALFLANLIGCLVVIPGLVTKKMSRTTKVPFGPMLIVGTLISFWFGSEIIGWYLDASLSLML